MSSDIEMRYEIIEGTCDIIERPIKYIYALYIIYRISRRFVDKPEETQS